MANLKGKMKKLQTAIVKAGVPIKINQTQFYSEDQERMITQYHVLIRDNVWSDKKKKFIMKDVEILKTCSMVEVVKCLLEQYRKVST